MRGCLNVTHDEVSCAHLEPELRCVPCQRDVVEALEAELVAPTRGTLFIRADLLRETVMLGRLLGVLPDA